MSKPNFSIQPMVESDLPESIAILNDTFRAVFLELTGAVPPGRSEGERLASRFYHPSVSGLVMRNEAGELVGAGFMQIYGSRSVGGPIGVRADLRASGLGMPLVRKLVELSAAAGCRVCDGCTFGGSPAHFMFHWKRGADPGFPALFFMRPLHAGPPSPRVDTAGLVVERYSAADAAGRARLRAGVTAVSGSLYAGFDLSSEVDHVAGRGLGETLVVSEGGRPVACAIAHFGPGSEAFSDQDLAFRFLIVEPGHPEAARLFHGLVEAGEQLAREKGLDMVMGLGSGGRRATVSAMLERGYRPIAAFTEFPFVHGADPLWAGRLDLATSSPEQYVLMELR
jgi:predicted N-acetyltransferase YhbS